MTVDVLRRRQAGHEAKAAEATAKAIELEEQAMWQRSIADENTRLANELAATADRLEVEGVT